MGADLLKAFPVETRRLLWLIGLVFITVILFQFIEFPKGSALWSLFSRGEVPVPKDLSLVGENSTSLSSNLSSPSVTDTSIISEDRNNSLVGLDEGRNGSLTLEEDPEPGNITELNSSSIDTRKEEIALPPEDNGNLSLAPIEPSVAPLSLPHNVPPNLSMELSTPPPLLPPPLVHVSEKKPKSKIYEKDVLTLSDMSEELIQNYLSPPTMVPRWSSKVDKDLVLAKQLIENAPPLNDGLYAPLYRNASMFKRSYELMEQMLKVYIYKEGDRRIFHRPPLEGIYASEGWFMKQMESNQHYVTKRPREAHLFYLPFSSRQLEEALYVPNSHSHKNLIQHLRDYVSMISTKYPYWNRTEGADHFFVACHDWAPSETKRIMANCIRALCNADVKEGFKFGKDVSLPETYVRKARNPLRDIGGKPPSKRKTLAFYAGNMHGYLRPLLLQSWGNNIDPGMKIFGSMPRSKDNRNYINYMKTSKYCICPRGYEVNSPRVVEAIFYECVPVIISDNFVPPFFETLNWESFAVFVAEKDIPNLKNILLSIPEKTFFRMHMRVKKVQQHFLWHPKPLKYDLFHMILHSIWYNRVFQFRPK
ncbi:probable glycosyltransferase At3g07620 [Chenopodium quinoa]|uniref:Exostosin GT47 domain-containing protein n=1 Tax=Chenopodium quinoa TaxID=63459 RepID=A0A803NDI3_CHEQI|nr:probable glycosyltransferase At3g07620 [Chenopodium quinoa]XP_021714873.1 probable glycosyltransferase At3g07620 [Chenopodium quinoa]